MLCCQPQIHRCDIGGNIFSSVSGREKLEFLFLSRLPVVELSKFFQWNGWVKRCFQWFWFNWLIVFILQTGRIDYNFGRVSGHNGPVTDLKWNPFNDNVIASASDDATVSWIFSAFVEWNCRLSNHSFQVKLWYIPDGGLKTAVTEWLCELVGHSRKVAYLDWHPTAENVLATAGFDHRVKKNSWSHCGI